MAQGTKAITVLDTTLEWGETGEATEKIIKITGFPDLGGAPNKIDVSTTEDHVEVGILGRQALDALEFEYFYDNDAENYKKVVADSGKQLHYVLKIKGGASGAFTWQGEHDTYLQGTEGDDAIKAMLTITASSKPTFLEPTAVGEGD